VYDLAAAYSEASDKALIELVKQRDVDAFTALYDRYAQPVYALAAHLLGPADADEIVQDVFLRLWDKAEQYDARRGVFRAWFMTIARYCIMDRLKERNQERWPRALDEVEQLLADGTDPATTVPEATWSSQRQAAMMQALQSLPEEQRRVIVLAYFGGFSQSAIAEHLGWPLGTVKKRIRLGMQKLRTYMAQWQAAV
jgi:RNA polymerase sigma-70 factor, ECF subfamily